MALKAPAMLSMCLWLICSVHLLMRSLDMRALPALFLLCRVAGGLPSRFVQAAQNSALSARLTAGALLAQGLILLVALERPPGRMGRAHITSLPSPVRGCGGSGFC